MPDAGPGKPEMVIASLGTPYPGLRCPIRAPAADRAHDGRLAGCSRRWPHRRPAPRDDAARYRHRPPAHDRGQAQSARSGENVWGVSERSLWRNLRWAQDLQKVRRGLRGAAWLARTSRSGGELVFAQAPLSGPAAADTSIVHWGNLVRPATSAFLASNCWPLEVDVAGAAALRAELLAAAGDQCRLLRKPGNRLVDLRCERCGENVSSAWVELGCCVCIRAGRWSIPQLCLPACRLSGHLPRPYPSARPRRRLDSRTEMGWFSLSGD